MRTRPDRGEGPFAYPPDRAPRIVKPIEPYSPDFRDVIAISEEGILTEAGEYRHIDALPSLVVDAPSSVIVAQGWGRHLQRLLRVYGEDPYFNYRVTPIYRDTRTRVSSRSFDTLINYVGFKNRANPKRKGHYHYPLDPVHFIRTSITELRPDLDESRLEKLLSFGVEVRNWCETQGIQIKATSGGIVAQLLRDPRFYPQPRRKVPGHINASARTLLPGNYYESRAERKRPYRAIYLDLESAHHQVAAITRFPHADTLRAWGNPDSNPSRLYVKGPDLPQLKRPGLFRLRVNIPHLTPNLFPPPWAKNGGTQDVWVYSNEFDFLQELHIRVEGIIGGFWSQEADEGLNAYARFAREELRENRTLKPWLKPTLLSTYGVLAARPMPFETGFLRAKGGTPTEYPMGPVSIPAKAHKTKKPMEARVANVIHRGMIEAGVRREALWFARYLSEVEGRHVLAVYADSVFIRDNGVPMKLLPPWWKIEEHVNNLRFYDSTHFTSDEIVRLPGLSRTKDDARRVEALLKRDAEEYNSSGKRRANQARRPFKPRRRANAPGQEQVRRERDRSGPEA